MSMLFTELHKKRSVSKIMNQIPRQKLHLRIKNLTSVLTLFGQIPFKLCCLVFINYFFLTKYG